jgi:hypothetical protein
LNLEISASVRASVLRVLRGRHSSSVYNSSTAQRVPVSTAEIPVMASLILSPPKDANGKPKKIPKVAVYVAGAAVSARVHLVVWQC